MIDYIQQQIYSQGSTPNFLKMLNKKLIDGYRNQCHGIWNAFPDDGYFHQNVIYYALIAEKNEDLENIMTDYKWMVSKIRSDKITYNLICDIEDYIHYLQDRNLVSINVTDFQ